MRQKILALILAAAMAVSLAACGSGASKDQETDGAENNAVQGGAPEPEETGPDNAAPEPANAGEDPVDLADMDTGSAAPEESAGSDTVSLDTVCSLIEMTLSENYSGCEVTHDDSMITANIWYDGLTAELTAAQLAGDDSYQESWNAAKENTVELSSTICDFIDTMGITDVYFNLNILNDINHENVLLTILEGSVLYDVMEG